MSGLEIDYRDGANRAGWLIVKDRLPCSSVVGCFENATVDLRHVKDIRLGRNAGDGMGATTAKRADVAPPQRAIKTRIGGQRPKCGYDKESRQPTRNRSISSHDEEAILCRLVVLRKKPGARFGT